MNQRVRRGEHSKANSNVSMADQEESKRISIQVSSLSTQLIESIDKQSQLEEQLLNAKKIISNQQTIVDSYNELRSELKAVKEAYQRDKQEYETKRKTYIEAEEKVESLNREIEDLTSSLFDEANNMVVDARKEKNAVEILNQKLKEQLKEKDLLFETLSIQLKNLKNVIYKLENEHNINSSKRTSVSESAMSSTLSIDKLPTNNGSMYDFSQIQSVLFSPHLQSLRYDVPLYTEYLKFLAALPNVENIQQTTSVSKLLKRLINYEITPVLRLDKASGIGWLLKRNLIGLMMDGLVSIEPISGINETYRTANFSPIINSNSINVEKDNHLFSRPTNSPPVAMLDPCAFCSEDRNDILEHGRLYVLKTLQKLENGQIEVTNQFPICHYCLLKFRQVCEIFAFLRSLKTGVWNLEKVSPALIKEGELGGFSAVSSPMKQKSKRMSILNHLRQSQTNTPVVEQTFSFTYRNGLPTTNIQRSWVRLSQLRASLLWSHIGVWSIDDAAQAEMSPSDSYNKQEVQEEEEEEEAALGLTNVPPVSLTTGENETFDFENGVKPALRNGLGTDVSNTMSKQISNSTSESPTGEVGEETFGPDNTSLDIEDKSIVGIKDNSSSSELKEAADMNEGELPSEVEKGETESIHDLLNTYDVQHSTEENSVKSLGQNSNSGSDTEYAEAVENST